LDKKIPDFREQENWLKRNGVKMSLWTNQRTVLSTFASIHEPAHIQKAYKRAFAFLTHVTTFQDSFRIAHAQKNKINLCFMDRLAQIDNYKKLKLNKWETDR
jgi:hypothetical protein